MEQHWTRSKLFKISLSQKNKIFSSKIIWHRESNQIQHSYSVQKSSSHVSFYSKQKLKHTHDCPNLHRKRKREREVAKGEPFDGFNKIAGGWFAHPLQEVMYRNVSVILHRRPPDSPSYDWRQSKNLFISDDDLTKKLEQRSIDKVEFCFADYDKTKNDSRFMKLVDVVRC